jgi:hypothetical protein
MMSLYLAVLVLCMSAVYAAPMFDSQLEGHWHLWKNWHSKNYHEVGVSAQVEEHIVIGTPQ